MNSGPLLSSGSTGPNVRRLQRVLVEMKLLGDTGIDGTFGADTKQAVESFQSGNGLFPDGVVGPLTWAALPADPETLYLEMGHMGPIVGSLQQALLTYGGTGSPTDPGPIDGKFGVLTRSAVKAYQAERGVTVDGIVGDRTWWVPAGGAGATLASLGGLTTV